LTYGAQTENVL